MRKTLSIFLSIIILATMLLTFTNTFNSTQSGLGMGSLRWNQSAENYCHKLFDKYDTDMEKVEAIMEWTMNNIQYVDYNMPLLQHFDIDETLETKQGICFEQASVFTTFCRIQGITCFNVDGRLKKNISVAHTWNRVYIDNQWYELDITNDQTVRKRGRTDFYGIQPISSKDAENRAYNIYRIY